MDAIDEPGLAAAASRQLNGSQYAASVDLIGIDEIAVPGQIGAQYLTVDLVEIFFSLIEKLDQFRVIFRQAAIHWVIFELAENAAQPEMRFLAAFHAAEDDDADIDPQFAQSGLDCGIVDIV